jgi:hypothetical protein
MFAASKRPVLVVVRPQGGLSGDLLNGFASGSFCRTSKNNASLLTGT